jgi:hypothetical protein
MSVLTRDQRAVIRADTSIDPFIIDRVCDAYDRLIDHDDVEGYHTNMRTATVQMGYPNIVPPEEDRPTPVDKMKTICIKAIAQERHWSFRRTAKWIEDAVS